MKYERLKAEEKARIIEAVHRSPLPAKQTLKLLGIPRSTYYGWLKPAPETESSKPHRQAWNQLLDSEVSFVISQALEMPDLSARDLSYNLTDKGEFSVSESSVYRILKAQGLIRQAVIVTAKADKEFRHKTSRVNEMWATDFMYIKVMGWGWYYVGGLLDDQSRYLICLELKSDMTGGSCSDLLQEGLERTGLLRIPPVQRQLNLLSDNGSGYLSDPFNSYLKEHGIHHIYTAVRHPQTNGKMERLNSTAKDRILQTVSRSPDELAALLEDFRYWYNYVHCHEGLSNLRPADVYNGRGDDILKARKDLKEWTLMRRYQMNMSGQSATCVSTYVSEIS
jgi:putative transposase